MAQTHFKRLDAEGRALHDNWDDIARLSLLVAVLAVIVWGACTALRELVHLALHALFEASEGRGAAGMVTLAVVLVLGALVRGALLRRDAWRSTTGDGIDLALSNYHVTYDHAGDDPQPRYARPSFALAARKSVATFLTLGTGGSGGLEAPMVLISESLAAGFSRVLRVRSEYELRTYQLVAIAAAVATLLGAPFTAALFATEIAYGDRIIYRKLAWALWAGVIAFWLNTRLHGYEPLFTAPAHSPEYALSEYGAAALVAVAVSMPLALGFGLAMSQLQQLVQRMRPSWHPPLTAAAVAAIALGLNWGFGLRFSHVLGTGEGSLRLVLNNSPELGPWWILLLLLFGKMVTSGLTLGGGGSAGLLIPSMYLGGLSGALVAKLVNLTGFAELDPALFAVVGIGSSLVAVVGVPLAAIALVFEVFGKAYGPPAILACGLTYLVTLKVKIYKQQRTSPDPEADETGGAETESDPVTASARTERTATG
jgi:CIC family chloride channel protein